MKNRFYFFLQGFLLWIVFVTSMNAQVMIISSKSVYLHSGYTDNMDKAFGEGKWQQFDYSTTNLDSILNTSNNYIYMEGVSNHFYGLKDFLGKHLAKLEKWVEKGNTLYINACPGNIGSDIILGFGNIKLGIDKTIDTVVAANIDHPIFKGPINPTSLTYVPLNSLFTSNTIQGDGLQAIIVSKKNNKDIILAEKNWGRGKVIFGTLQSPEYARPQIEYINLRSNILNMKPLPLNVNAGLNSFVPIISKKEGTQSITVSLSNYGNMALSKATVNWEVDGALQTPFIWTKGLPAFQDNKIQIDSFPIGTFTFEKAKKYTIRYWLSQLNGDITPSTQDTLSQIIHTSIVGNYGIGRDNSDFKTLADAVNALIDVGVTGPTVFNLSSDYHLLPIDIPYIKGTSNINTVTFQSQSGDSSSTFIYAERLRSSALSLKGTAYLKFKNLTILFSGSMLSYGNAVQLQGGCHDLSFNNCLIQGYNYRYNYGGVATILFLATSSGDTLNPSYNIEFKNNNIIYGSYGIHAQPYSKTNAHLIKGISIINNRFSYHYFGGVHLNNSVDLKITGNKFIESYVESYTGVAAINTEGFYINNNIILLQTTGKGIRISQSNDIKPNYIYNNAVYGDGNSLITAITVENCLGLTILHNTVNLSNSYMYSSAFEVLGNNNDIKLYNNNFCVTGTGLAAKFSSTDGLVSNYNNFYTAGKQAFQINKTVLKDLNDWQSLSHQDTNSVSVNAEIQTDEIYKASKGMLDGTGKPFSEVQTDLEGDPRDPLHPDIGADEFESSGLDLYIVSSTVPSVPFKSGNHEIRVKVRNSSLTTITDFKVAAVHNKTDTTKVSWTGILKKGESVEVTIGTLNFLPKTNNSLSIGILAPNKAEDINPKDNIVTYNDLFPSLPSGIYTLGGNTPDFNSFGEVQNQLNIGGIMGDVTFWVRDGTYQEHIALSNVIGSGPGGKIAFRSESGDSSKVVLKYYVNDSYDSSYVVQLQNTSHVKFSNMTFSIDGKSYAMAINMKGKNSNITFANNAIVSKEDYSQTSYNHTLVQITDSISTQGDVVFQNNLLIGSNYGFYIRTTASATGKFIAKDNILRNQYSNAFYINQTNYSQLVSNKIFTASPYSSYNAIYTYYSGEGVKILKNHIDLTKGGSLLIENAKATTLNKFLIANNFIKVNNVLTAVNIYSCENVDVYYNTILNNSTQTNSCALKTSSNGLNLYNNLIINTGAGYALYFAGVNDHLTNKYDYNNYFSNGANLLCLIQNYSDKPIATLNLWRAFTGQDVNSSSMDPMLTINTPIVGNPRLNGIGMPIPMVTDDINSKTRGQFPDMGAVEFSVEGINLSLNDLTIAKKKFETGLQPIKVLVRNNGTTPITSFTLKWNVNGTVQTDLLWTGNLAPDAIDTVVAGSIDFKIGQKYNFELVAQDPNKTIDIDTSDNKLSIKDIFASLKGDYTIGGTDPDFATFTLAAAVLNQSGVAGSVTFNVRPGTYNEQIRLREISGADFDKRIVFQSESNDKTSVTLSYTAPSSSKNYTLLLDSTDHVTFRNMTISSENNTYSTVIVMTNGASHNIFYSNRILSPINSGYNNLDISNSSNTNSKLLINQKNIIENNEFVNGNYGVYFYNSLSYDIGNVIRKNVFKRQRNGGINMRYQQNPIIVSNTLISDSNSTNYKGIYVSSTKGTLLIKNNKITVLNAYTAIQCESFNGQDTSQGIIANNFCTVKGAGTSAGIYISRNYYLGVYYNSVLFKSNNPTASAFESSQNFYLSIANNNFINLGAGTAAKYNDQKNAKLIDNNNYFATNNKLFSPDINLADWKKQNNVDSNSVSINPLFLSDTSLKPLELSLNSLGRPIKGIEDDIDGEMRNMLKPSIGADEFVPTENDAGIYKITNPIPPFVAGNRPISILLRNYGANTLENATIYWALNGTTQEPIAWSGRLVLGDTTTVTLPSVNFSLKSAYTLKIWCGKPNASVDKNPINDTLLLGPIYPALNGNYTVGGTNPNFSTLKEAIEALTLGGIVDSVHFNIRKGIYNEQLVLPAIKGAKLRNAIVFQSESGVATDVVISASGTSAKNYIVRLDASDGVSFKNLSLTNTNSSYGRVIHLYNGSDYTTLDNVIFNGQYNTESLLHTETTFQTINNEYLNINRCTFNNGKTGIYATGTSTFQKGLVIRNNKFNNFYNYGIEISYQNAAIINGNVMKSDATNSSKSGIHTISCNDAITIINNSIILSNGGTGIQLYSIKTIQPNPSTIANNFIQISHLNYARGIYNNNNDYINIYHNTIRINCENRNSNTYALSILGRDIKVFNNNLHIATKGYFLYISVTSDIKFSSNYNNFYSAGEYWNYYGKEIMGMDLWKQSTKEDHLSLSINPKFKNAEDPCMANSALDDLVPYLKGINQDMNGQPRKAMTDVGACEIVPLGIDASLIGFASPIAPIATNLQEVKVTLFNNGTLPINSVQIDWAVNGIAQSPVNWTGSLASQNNVSVNLGNYNFEKSKSYKISSWITSTNGTEDFQHINDTITKVPVILALSGIYTIGGTAADFPNFTKAIEALHQGGVSGAVEFRVNDGIYSEQLKIEKILGVSAQNTVTFTSASEDSNKVTISFDNNTSAETNYTVLVKGCSYINFKRITFTALNYYNATVLSLSEGSSYINIFGCVFIGRLYSKSIRDESLITSTGGSVGNKFINNLFLESSYGIRLNGTTNVLQNNEIIGNKFLTQSLKAIFLSNQSNLIIQNNIITPSPSIYDNYAAIHLTNAKEGTVISGNQVILPEKRSIGIYLNTVVGNSNKPALVYNNFINHLKPDENTGIYMDLCQYLGMYYNSVRIDGTATILKEAFKVNAGSNIDVKNNIFAHFGQGRAMEITGNPTNLSSDYNDYFSNGSTIIMRTNAYNSLEGYQSVFTTDYNSKSIDPTFVAASNPHIKQANLDGAGTPIGYVTVDIDGHNRHSENPDIGADEFGAGLITKDVGIVSVLGPLSNCKFDEPQYLYIKIQNFGVDTISKLDLHYILNDTLHVSETLEGVQIRGGQSYNYKFKTPVNMSAHDLYSFDVYTSMDIDSNPLNDTIFNHVIQHYPLANADAGRDTIICKSQYYYLLGKKGVKYTWQILGSEQVYSNFGGVAIYPSQKTTYVLKSYNIYNCVAFDTVTIDIKPLPTTPQITVKGALESLCASDSVTLTSSIDKNIKWFNGDTTQSVLVTKSGTYTVTHTHPESQCSTSASVTITKPESPQLSAPGPMCPGTEALLSISGNGRFLWSTGETTSSIRVKPKNTTVYKVKITMSDGCEMERSATVGIKTTGIVPKITKVIGDSAICLGNQATLRVEGSADNFRWSNGEFGSTINVSPKQKTTFTVTANGGDCVNETASANFTVKILPGPTQVPIIVATGSSSLSFCETSAITLNSSDYNESILWSTGDTTPSITVYSQGIYSLSHLSKYGCSKSSSVKIEDPATPYIVGKTELCKGQSTTLTVVNGTSFRWSNGATSNSITVQPEKTTEYAVTIQNKEGCTYQQKIKVNIYEIPVVTSISADTTICEGSEITLSVAGKAKEFLWTGGQVGNTIKVKPNKTTTYGVRATNGCPEQSTNDYLNVIVTVLPSPLPVIIKQGDSIQICADKPIQLTSSISDSIRWSTKATSPTITVKDTGTYTLYHYNRYACVSSSNIKVSYLPKPYITVNGQNIATTCIGDNANLTYVNSKNTIWSTGANTTSIWVSPEQNTKYVVHGQNDNGCNFSDSIFLKVIEPIAPEPIQNILPLNGKSDLSLPLSLSWTPSNHASHYDIRYWNDTETIPLEAQIKNIEQILYRLDSGLAYGNRYKWQVSAKNSCKETRGPIQELELRHLPDLSIKNVLVPTSAFSGQEILVSWELKNQGKGRSMSKEYWHDIVYLSSDSTFQPDIDIMLGNAINKTALDTGQSYISSTLVTLPENNVGTYYVFVVSNGEKTTAEINFNNNIAKNKRYLLIQLTPPPDLQVTEVRTLSNIFSGQTMNLVWTVTNNGEGKTKKSTWQDRIYFSSDSVLRTGSALILATVPHSGHLDSKGAYAPTLPIAIPQGIYGKYYIHVVTDILDNVYEHAYNGNNTGRSTVINVTLQPPSDLVTSILAYPLTNLSNKDKTIIKWKVKNQGGSITSNYQWKDEIFISNKNLFDISNSKLIGSRMNYTALDLDEEYEATASVIIPEEITGTSYIFILTDRGNEVFEHNNKSNNMVRSPAFTVTTPDLVIKDIKPIEEPFTSGKPVKFKWVLKNNGTGVLHASEWTESIAVKESVSSDTTMSWSRASFTQKTNGDLKPGDSISVIRSIDLPEGIKGTWYLVGKTNTSKTVYESPSGSLNNTINKSIAVNLAPWTDLNITELSTTTDSAQTGSTWPLRITVKNIGETVLKDSLWVDKVYISSQSTLYKDTILLTGVRANFTLAKDSTYTYDIDVPIPHDIEPGNYYFHVFTDATNEVYEHTGEDNNRSVYGPVSIRYGMGPDLVLSEVKAPDSVLSGTIHKLSWKVQNKGVLRTFNIWDDAVYLSKDTIWQPNTDLYIASKLAKNDLDTAASYVSSEQFTVPENIEGQFYWILVADYDIKGKPFIESGDRNRDNNIAFVPVYVSRNTSPDLALSNIQVPEEGVAGQPIKIQYTVTNKGSGATRPKKWTDRIYLSTDLQIDSKDQILTTIERKDVLSVGAYYTHIQELTLPLIESGNYILLVKTDQEDVQFEEGLESNNIDFATIHIEMPLPADLQITNIKAAKGSYFVGDSIKLIYTIQNQGINPVKGIEEEQFYLSKNTVWDIEDITLGNTSSTLNLPPGGTTTFEKSFILNNASVGDYYLIARTDVKNQIPETKENNNMTSSVASIYIDVKELLLNVKETSQIKHKGSICYKIIVPDSLYNETLLVELQSLNLFNHNELFIRYGDVPTRNIYDVSFSKPFSGNQEVIIPELKPGIYYVMAYGENEQLQEQEVTLMASILRFNIRSVKTNVGGDTGPVTTCIQGAKFKPSTQFFLSHNYEVIKAKKVYYISPTKVFATFDLIGVARGYYDVMAQDSITNDKSFILSAFKVEKGTPQQLDLDLDHPSATRRSMIIPIQVHFANGGNIDIPTPKRAVVFTGIKQPLALNVPDLKYFITSLNIDFIEPEGPQDVLRPGAFSDRTLYVYTLGHIRLKIIKR